MWCERVCCGEAICTRDGGGSWLIDYSGIDVSGWEMPVAQIDLSMYLDMIVYLIIDIFSDIYH